MARRGCRFGCLHAVGSECCHYLFTFFLFGQVADRVKLRRRCIPSMRISPVPAMTVMIFAADTDVREEPSPRG